MDVYRLATIGLAAFRLPLDALAGRWRPSERASEWALGLRFPHEDLSGLDLGARVAFAAARSEALWRHGIVIGLTSGGRSFAEQQRLFDEAVSQYGSESAARQWVLPPAESLHTQGRALDIRPVKAPAGSKPTATATAFTAPTPTSGGTSNTGPSTSAPAPAHPCAPTPASPAQRHTECRFRAAG
ncbi:D-alanyl-D-alanine carboxypeptidase family protein [Kutzneria kofuensis]|uniref:D-alanyl-D-alanine carboxypeptidase family protein n=1 Tax=Kutzneria kofuensis TaxID=103725 RepID=UPI0031EC9B49